MSSVARGWGLSERQEHRVSRRHRGERGLWNGLARQVRSSARAVEPRMEAYTRRSDGAAQTVGLAMTSPCAMAGGES